MSDLPRPVVHVKKRQTKVAYTHVVSIGTCTCRHAHITYHIYVYMLPIKVLFHQALLCHPRNFTAATVIPETLP